MAQTILHIDSSARREGSQSRILTTAIVDSLSGDGDKVIRRDVGQSTPPAVTEDRVNANFTPDADRSTAQREILSGSDALVEELLVADSIVIGVPVYNFGIPAALKAWIDQVARARKTFQYSETGPVGLLEDKKAYVVVTSGGTEAGSEIDFATPYLRHVLGFLGIHDVEFVLADRLMFSADEKLGAAHARIADLKPAIEAPA